jgi:hypothetical protein
MPRPYEVLQHVEMPDQDHLIPGARYHVGPATNEHVEERIGKSWVSEIVDAEPVLRAGPFDSNEDGCRWVVKVITPHAVSRLGLKPETDADG